MTATLSTNHIKGFWKVCKTEHTYHYLISIKKYVFVNMYTFMSKLYIVDLDDVLLKMITKFVIYSSG